MTKTMVSSWSHDKASVRSSRLFTVRKAIAFIVLLATMITTMLAFVTATAPRANADLVRHALCSWGWPNGGDTGGDTDSSTDGDGSANSTGDDDGGVEVRKVMRPALIYQLSQTEDAEKAMVFKSEAGAEAGSVKYNLANLISGKDYEKATLDIANNANATSTKYTPYDLFGYAGLKWSAYQGEWNWIKVYYCGEDNHSDTDKDPEDQKINLYYEGRNRPLDTWADRANSKDPRVQLKSLPVFITYEQNKSSNVSNFIFWFTKLIVSFNNMLIEKSLSNVAKDLGFIDITKQIMTNLFNGLFLGLLAMVMALMGFSLIWTGLIKRRFTTFMQKVARSFLIILIAAMMMAAPTLFVSLPNDAGMLMQFLVMSATSSTIKAGKDNDMCSTEVKNDVSVKNDNSFDLFKDGKVNEDSITNWVENIGSNTGRAISCQYWRLFALTPWTIGQYGTTYDNLWAKGKAPSGQHDIGYSFVTGAEGTQDDYPGLAAVPLGNNQVINNWAVYQLSVQSTSHIPSSMADPKEGKIASKPNSPYTSVLQIQQQNRLIDNTFGDWWRIVDAVSGWDTNSKESGGSSDSGSSTDSSSATQGMDGALAWAQKTAQDPAHGYSQTNRTGPDYDCSSFVSTALKTAGFNVDIFNTGGEQAELTKAGFKKVDGANLSTGDGLKPGDILLGPTHTEFYMGGGNTLGAHKADSKGLTGDQGTPDGPEIGPGKITDYKNYTSAWRYGDGNVSVSSDGSSDSSSGSGLGAYTQKPGAVKTDYWNNWIGSNSFGRMATALLSVVACLALIAPIALGVTILVASIGSVILMAFAPVFLLLGLFPNFGQQVITKWLQMLWGTVVRRTVIGVVYMFVLVVISDAMNGIMSATDYAKSIVLVVLFSLVFYKMKDKIIDVFMSKFNVGEENKVSRKMAALGKGVKNYGEAAGIGAVMAARGTKRKDANGVTVRDASGKAVRDRAVTGNKKGKHYGTFRSIMASATAGAAMGVKSQAKRDLQRTRFGRAVNDNLDMAKRSNDRARLIKAGIDPSKVDEFMLRQRSDSVPGGTDEFSGQSTCMCQEHVDMNHMTFPTETMQRTDDGLLVCSECYNNFRGMHPEWDSRS